MDDNERTAVTHLPPPPDSPSDVSASVSTLPPAGGEPPAELAPDSSPAPESDPTLRAEPERFASPQVERLSIQRLLDMNRRVEGYMVELLDPKGAFAQNRIQMVTDLSLVVDNGFRRVIETLEPRFKAQDDRMAKLEAAQEQLKTRMTELETEIRLLKEQRGTGTEAAPAPPA